MYGYIYRTINLINDKIYIGQHKSSIFEPEYCGSGKYLKRAVKKYGRDNFYVELLERCDSKEMLDERERYYIEKYNSRDSNVGYNIAYGGEGGDLVSCLPEEEYQRFVSMMSDMNRQGIIGNKGKHLSESHRKKISESNMGKIRSKESNIKQSISMKGKPAWNKGLTADDFRVAKYVHKKGEFHHTAETKKLLSKKLSGRKVSFSKEHREHLSQSQIDRIRSANEIKRLQTIAIGRIWVNNGDKSKMIFPEELQTYLKQGYKKGRIYKRK